MVELAPAQGPPISTPTAHPKQKQADPSESKGSAREAWGSGQIRCTDLGVWAALKSLVRKSPSCKCAKDSSRCARKLPGLPTLQPATEVQAKAFFLLHLGPGPGPGVRAPQLTVLAFLALQTLAGFFAQLSGPSPFPLLMLRVPLLIVREAVCGVRGGMRSEGAQRWEEKGSPWAQDSATYRQESACCL